jgi:hypothetical protein
LLDIGRLVVKWEKMCKESDKIGRRSLLGKLLPRNSDNEHRKPSTMH